MYCLQSKSFERDIYKSWRELQVEKHLCDVTLACEDNQVEAHKVILSSCSPVFKNLLKQNPHQHPLLYLRGVKYSELINMLDFMYQGEVSIAQDDLNDFLDVGQDLKVRGITDDGDETEGTEELDYNKENDLIMDGDEASEQNIHISEPYTLIKYINEDTAPIVITNSTSEVNSRSPDNLESPEDLKCSDEILNYDRLNIKTEPAEPIIEPMTVKFDIADESDDECDMTEPGVISQKDGDSKDVRHYYCEKCDYESVNRGDLRRHVAAKHSKSRFSCKQKNCKFKTAKKKLLKRHVDVVHKKCEMSCKRCRFSTNNKDDLIKHMKGQHNEELVNHMKIQSTKEKPLQSNVMQLNPTNQNIFMSKAVQQFVEQRILQSKLVPPCPILQPKPVAELRQQIPQIPNPTKPTNIATRSSNRIANKSIESTETSADPEESSPNPPITTKNAPIATKIAPLTTNAKIEKIEKTLSNKQSSGGTDMKEKLQTLLGNISVSIVKH